VGLGEKIKQKDYNPSNQNSFGFSLWTEERAKNYCDELVIKVKVHKEDLACLIHSGNKIRATKIEVLT